MILTRRKALGLLAAGASAAGVSCTSKQSAPSTSTGSASPDRFHIAKGPFTGTRESLQAYRTPEWFADAKFGMWAHWGPQSGVEAGDWYARNMYMQGSDQYKYHVKRFGHPSKVGFKDLIPMFKGAEFDPNYLIGLYKKAGAKYFMSMGVHHDNFDMWNSKHTRWNAANMGPKKDVVGMWKKAAYDHGLKFGVSEHLWITYKWFSVSHGSDQTGPLAGVAYDGQNPQFSDLYTKDTTVYTKLPWNDDDIPDAWKQHWYARIKDLVDNYQPDLLYTDGALPFEEYGLNAVANLYNLSAQRNGGQYSAVYTSKRPEDCATGTCVLDVERGVVDQIWPQPWQTDTCIGDWHYKRGMKYKKPKVVIDLLTDIVSRNGNLMLNVPLPNSGMPDAEELKVVAGITDWMKVNSEGIYATRPWKIYGDGPSTKAASDADAKFNEDKRKALTAEDVRFTTKGDTLYAFVMGWPDKRAVIAPLGAKSSTPFGKVANVELLGHDGKLKWTQAEDGLKIDLPKEKPSDYAVTFKVTKA
jgi:alpha-L-fucosidase